MLTAVARQSFEVVKVLVRAGSDVTASDKVAGLQEGVKVLVRVCDCFRLEK